MSFTLHLSAKPCDFPHIYSEVSKFGEFVIDKAKCVGYNRGIRTTNIAANTAYGINGGLVNEIGHLDPRLHTEELLQDVFSRRIEELRDRQTEPLKGFIIGGLECKPQLKENKQSFDFGNMLADIFDHFEIPFTMIFGKKANAPVDNIYAMNKNITAWGDSFKDTLALPKNPDVAELKEILQKHFQIVELSDEIPIDIIK